MTQMGLASPGDRVMLNSMGLMSWCRNLLSGRRAPANPEATLAAAEAGDVDAQFALGLKFSTAGEGTPDFEQAAQWYRKAADQGHPLAQCNLGMMLAKGQGVPKDDAAARTWVRLGAEGGDASAQFNLGTQCHRASVDPRQGDREESRIEAFKWLHLAAAQGYLGSVAACERVTLNMTRQEVESGHRRVSEFVARRAVPATTPPASRLQE